MPKKSLVVLSDDIQTSWGITITNEFIHHLSEHIDVYHLKKITNKSLPKLREVMTKCDGIFLIEFLIGSKILSILEFALENNISIFALCGDIYSYTSKGPSFLIKTGAISVVCFQDILDHLT